MLAGKNILNTYKGIIVKNIGVLYKAKPNYSIAVVIVSFFWIELNWMSLFKVSYIIIKLQNSSPY